MEYSVVIPVYNEAPVLVELHRQLQQALAAVSGSFELIFVNDGSQDASLDILREIARQNFAVRIITYPRNQGQSAAWFAGMRAARGNWIITIDADLQNPPSEIARLLEHRKQYDIVTGVRQQRADTWLRRFSSGLARTMRRLALGDTCLDTGCSLRIIRREVVEQLPFFRNCHRFFLALAQQAGFSILEIPVQHQARWAGCSKYRTWQRAWDGMFDLVGVFWLQHRLIKKFSHKEFGNHDHTSH
jgi:dolichol-phosphate mannosyltransferase